MNGEGDCLMPGGYVEESLALERKGAGSLAAHLIAFCSSSAWSKAMTSTAAGGFPRESRRRGGCRIPAG